MTKWANRQQFITKVVAFNAPIQSGAIVDKYVRALLLKGLAFAIQATPVDTGYLAYNWLAYVNKPPDSPRGKYGPQYASNPAMVLDRIPKTFIGYRKAWIVNNVSYSYDVEEGSSRIRAHKMLAKTHLYLLAQMRLTSLF
jgi:hypothetical protein